MAYPLITILDRNAITYAQVVTSLSRGVRIGFSNLLMRPQGLTAKTVGFLLSDDLGIVSLRPWK